MNDGLWTNQGTGRNPSPSRPWDDPDLPTPTSPRRSLGMIYYAADARTDQERLDAYQRKLVEDLRKDSKI